MAKAMEAEKAATEAIAEGTLKEEPLRREDFLTDDELLREMMDAPILPRD